MVGNSFRQREREREREVVHYRQRIPSKSVFYYRCPDHGNNYVLSFAFAFDREADTYYVSEPIT